MRPNIPQFLLSLIFLSAVTSCHRDNSPTPASHYTTDTLTTSFPNSGFTPYELMFLSNPATNNGDSTTPDLLAEAYNLGAYTTYGNSYFRFNLTPIPAGTTLRSATLYLFSDTLPQYGDGVHANTGLSDDLVIQRVAGSWDQHTLYSNQPSLDTVGKIHVPATTQHFLNLQIDVTTIVNNMTAEGNYGFEMHLLIGQPGTSRIFCSSRYFDARRHPFLVVTY
jgi:hypothetical protein